MRVVKSLAGWLCFLSLIGFVFFTGYWIYTLGAPFFRGAVLYQLPYPSAPEMARTIGARGVAADNNALLKAYAVKPAVPTGRWIGWDAVGRMWDRMRIPQPGPLTSALAVAVLDERGKVLSAYPKALVGQVFPFGYSIDQVNDDIERSSDGQLYGGDSTNSTFGHVFLPAARRYVPNAETLYLNKLIGPRGRTVGILAIATPRDRKVLYLPKEAQTRWLIPPPTALSLAVASLLLYLALLPVWVGLDAGWRGMRPFAWGILVALTGWIGLLAYLIARLPAPGTCYNCGEKVLGKYVRCPSCGVDLANRCPVCRRKIKPGWQYCPTCRGSQPEPTQPAVIAPAESAESQAKPTAQCGLQVRVLDAETGIPIQDASILVSGPVGRGGRTNAHGVFDAQRLKDGLYTARASKQGWDSTTAELEIGEAGSESTTLRLRPLPGIMAGRVINRSTQAPIAGARVYLDTSRLDRSVETDSDGRFLMGDVPAGPYTVCAEAEGFAAQTKLAQVVADQQVVVDFALEPAAE